MTVAKDGPNAQPPFYHAVRPSLLTEPPQQNPAPRFTVMLTVLLSLHLAIIPPVCLPSEVCPISDTPPVMECRPIQQYICALYIDGSEVCIYRVLGCDGTVEYIEVEAVICPDACSCLAQKYAQTLGYPAPHCEPPRRRSVTHGATIRQP